MLARNTAIAGRRLVTTTSSSIAARSLSAQASSSRNRLKRIPPQQRRTIFGFLKSKSKVIEPTPVAPIIASDDLFHPLSQSPIPTLRQKANRIKSLSLCPVSLDVYGEHIHPEYDCPNCGFPTHATRERWEEGKAEHDEVCGRLREVNEDEHDLRSGRRMTEFDNMPGMYNGSTCVIERADRRHLSRPSAIRVVCIVPILGYTVLYQKFRLDRHR